MKLIVNILSSFIIIIGIFYVLDYFGHGGYISSETEQKYLRNISKFYPISKRHCTTGLSGGDTLSFAAKVLPVDLFNKWYIYKVGLVRRDSELSKKFDSIAATYKNELNKLK